MRKGKSAKRGVGRLFLVGAAIGSAAGAVVAGRLWRRPKSPRMTVIPVTPTSDREPTTEALEA